MRAKTSITNGTTPTSSSPRSGPHPTATEACRSSSWNVECPASTRPNLDKLGLHCQDTSELAFTDVRVPKENLLGEVGAGFFYLMRNLAQERMQIAVGSLGRARAALRWTVDHVRERTAFGKPIGARHIIPALCWPTSPPRYRSLRRSSTAASSN